MTEQGSIKWHTLQNKMIQQVQSLVLCDKQQDKLLIKGWATFLTWQARYEESKIDQAALDQRLATDFKVLTLSNFKQ